MALRPDVCEVGRLNSSEESISWPISCLTAISLSCLDMKPSKVSSPVGISNDSDLRRTVCQKAWVLESFSSRISLWRWSWYRLRRVKQSKSGSGPLVCADGSIFKAVVSYSEIF